MLNIIFINFVISPKVVSIVRVSTIKEGYRSLGNGWFHYHQGSHNDDKGCDKHDVGEVLLKTQIGENCLSIFNWVLTISHGKDPLRKTHIGIMEIPKLVKCNIIIFTFTYIDDLININLYLTLDHFKYT